MTTVIDLLTHEEGFRARPYLCSEGYPTVGIGFRLGPKITGPNAKQRCEMLYDFTLPLPVAQTWLVHHVTDLVDAMAKNQMVRKALDAAAAADGTYEGPRCAVLISMAFQMGLDGLAGFRQTLLNAQAGLWGQVATQMLKSRWANQTPKRARRHARQMETGQWDPVYTQEA